MGAVIYSFNLNISPNMSYDVLRVILSHYRIPCLGFCNKDSVIKAGVFVPDPVYSNGCSPMASYFGYF